MASIPGPFPRRVPVGRAGDACERPADHGLANASGQHGTLYALDAKTGDSVWQDEVRATPNSTPVVVDGVLPGQLLDPRYITTDSEGNVWVADYGNNRVQAFTHEGELMTGWCDFGSEPGQFRNLTDVVLDSEGRVLVADLKNGWVQAFTADGELLGVWHVGAAPNGAPNWPYAV